MAGKHTMEEINPSKTEIWMDGDCQLCRLSEKWASRRDTASRLRFIDMRQQLEGSLPVPRHELEQAMHVTLPNGTVLKG
ncbi:MAG: DUF393 domain-containing protein, partial [bacterium]|nr:DUF393 domain-containing protein [bacterium]